MNIHLPIKRRQVNIHWPKGRKYGQYLFDLPWYLMLWRTIWALPLGFTYALLWVVAVITYFPYFQEACKFVCNRWTGKLRD